MLELAASSFGGGGVVLVGRGKGGKVDEKVRMRVIAKGQGQGQGQGQARLNCPITKWDVENCREIHGRYSISVSKYIPHPPTFQYTELIECMIHVREGTGRQRRTSRLIAMDSAGMAHIGSW